MGLHTKELFQIQWKELLSSAQQLHFHKGQVIYYEGHLPYGIYWIKEGTVRFFHQEPCEQQHDLKPMEHFESQWLGLETILSNQTNCCTCIADADCEIFFVNRTLLNESLQKDSLHSSLVGFLKN